MSEEVKNDNFIPSDYRIIITMTVIKRTGYLNSSNCDAMVSALPIIPVAVGKEYRTADDKSKISVYQLLRYYSYPESLKTVWKTNIPNEVSSSYLVSTFMKIPKDSLGILYPTTPSDPTRYDLIDHCMQLVVFFQYH